MTKTAKQAFAGRLVELLRDGGYVSARNARSGVDVAPLAKVAEVSREMARRYTEGTAMPDVNRMQKIADWGRVRLAWLRDGEGPKAHGQPGTEVRERPAAPYLSEEALEIARIWSSLPEERKECFRSLMALEAVVANRYPWLMFGRPKSESYRHYEERVERDILRLTAKLTQTK